VRFFLTGRGGIFFEWRPDPPEFWCAGMIRRVAVGAGRAREAEWIRGCPRRIVGGIRRDDLGLVVCHAVVVPEGAEMSTCCWCSLCACVSVACSGAWCTSCHVDWDWDWRRCALRTTGRRSGSAAQIGHIFIFVFTPWIGVVAPISVLDPRRASCLLSPRVGLVTTASFT
jgi:hypothetical protein